MAAQVPESDQTKQFQEFLGTYNKLIETCFMHCVKDFRGQQISMRLQKYHIQHNEALSAKVGLLGQPK
ncbi:mitochondrial import inner membrane translocase subunit Tim9-like isoform X1 [Molossus molossus]|uniref:mitochondrial import inner membrane translocase subunit Tim9-like isoform X1 n=1 Tax=Molossus molossus TaxID=27622 RepID=UPI001747352A|nr:mitochondrial import inner membrane translocase subunit Tim9-like isoform X1 [Molossus molossus]